MKPNHLHDELIDQREVRRLLGGPDRPIHRSTLWRWLRADRVPGPMEVGPGVWRWWRGEINDYRERLKRITYTAP